MVENFRFVSRRVGGYAHDRSQTSPAKWVEDSEWKETDQRPIVIFDGIHWSGEMEQFWRTFSQHKAVRCSIDPFFIGIVFFRKEFKEKQHFVIRF